MAKIDSLRFGAIVVGGKKYRRDVVLLPNGTVHRRKGGILMFGDHNFKREEIEELSKAGAEVIIIGIGTNSKGKVSEEVKDYARKSGLELQVFPSYEAVQKFNQLVDQDKKVAGIIHITC